MRLGWSPENAWGRYLAQWDVSKMAVISICILLIDSICISLKYISCVFDNKITVYHVMATNRKQTITWRRHQMETFSALLDICAGNSPVPGEFPAQKPVTRSFDVFFDLHPNKRMSKHWWGWWFETPSCPLWCHCNDLDKLTDAIVWRLTSENSWCFKTIRELTLRQEM